MLPPVCALCGSGEGAAVVRFADESPADDGFAPDGLLKGQPADTEWFCRQHLAAARALSDRSRSSALSLLMGDADTVVGGSFLPPLDEGDEGTATGDDAPQPDR